MNKGLEENPVLWDSQTNTPTNSMGQLNSSSSSCILSVGEFFEQRRKAEAGAQEIEAQAGYI